MSDGVLYKANATTWSKSQSKKFNATTISDGNIKHANASAWFKNYPMEQEYTQNFSVQWTQGYNGSGIKLDPATWGDDLFTGDTVGFQSMLGFDKNAIQSFVGNGQILSVKLHINLKSTSTNGSPDVYFCPHVYASLPSSLNLSNWNKNYRSSFHFPNKAYGGYWVDLTKDHIKNPSTGAFWNGIAMYGFTNTAEDSGRWTGKSGYNSELQIKVLK
jgi:hypothetical protein